MLFSSIRRDALFHTLLLLLLLTFYMPTSLALAKELPCKRYAIEAVRQNQQNLSIGANFSGPAWSNDFNSHYNWCMHGNNLSTTPIHLQSREVALQKFSITQGKELAAKRYAAEAVRQYNESQSLATNFTLPAWSPDFNSHYNWSIHGANLASTPDHLAAREKALQEFAIANNKGSNQKNMVKSVATTQVAQPSGVISAAEMVNQQPVKMTTIEKVVPYSGGNNPPPPPGGGMYGYDFFVTVKGLKNHTYIPEPVTHNKIVVAVFNDALKAPTPFSIGLGKTNKAKINDSTSWESVYSVPANTIETGTYQLFYLQIPPTVTSSDILFVMVDIHNEIGEKNENNNRSKSFQIRYPEPNSTTLKNNADTHTKIDEGRFEKLTDKDLEFNEMRITGLYPKVFLANGATGKYAILSSVKVVVEYESNKPFMFASDFTPPKGLKDESVWSLAVPLVTIGGSLTHSLAVINMMKQNKYTHHSSYFDRNDFIPGVPYQRPYRINEGPYRLKFPQGILPKGKNTLVFELENAGPISGYKIMAETEIQWKFKKCMIAYYPYFSVRVFLDTYQGSNHPNVFHSSMTEAYDKPPIWEIIDPWVHNYFGKDGKKLDIPRYAPTVCAPL